MFIYLLFLISLNSLIPIQYTSSTRSAFIKRTSASRTGKRKHTTTTTTKITKAKSGWLEWTGIGWYNSLSFPNMSRFSFALLLSVKSLSEKGKVQFENRNLNRYQYCFYVFIVVFIRYFNCVHFTDISNKIFIAQSKVIVLNSHMRFGCFQKWFSLELREKNILIINWMRSWKLIISIA